LQYFGNEVKTVFRFIDLFLFVEPWSRGCKESNSRSKGRCEVIQWSQFGLKTKLIKKKLRKDTTRSIAQQIAVQK